MLSWFELERSVRITVRMFTLLTEVLAENSQHCYIANHVFLGHSFPGLTASLQAGLEAVEGAGDDGRGKLVMALWALSPPVGLCAYVGYILPKWP